VELQLGKQETRRTVDSPSAAIGTGGKGTIEWNGVKGECERLEASLGDVLLVGASTKIRFESGADRDTVGYRASSRPLDGCILASDSSPVEVVCA